MLIIFLCNFPRIYIILLQSRLTVTIACLRQKAYLDDLLVGHTSKEYILLILVRVEANDVGNFSIAETLQTLTGFRVPQLHLTIVTAGKKLTTII